MEVVQSRAQDSSASGWNLIATDVVVTSSEHSNYYHHATYKASTQREGVHPRPNLCARVTLQHPRKYARSLPADCTVPLVSHYPPGVSWRGGVGMKPPQTELCVPSVVLIKALPRGRCSFGFVFALQRSVFVVVVLIASVCLLFLFFSSPSTTHVSPPSSV